MFWDGRVFLRSQLIQIESRMQALNVLIATCAMYKPFGFAVNVKALPRLRVNVRSDAW